MIGIQVSSADEAWRSLLKQFRTLSNIQPSRDQPTKELLHVAISITDPRQRVVFARPINPAFAIAETVWILAGSDDLSFVKFWNPRMGRYSDDGVTLCGAYGYRLGSQPPLDDVQEKMLRHGNAKSRPIDQLRMANEALRKTSHSRQVVLQIWDKNLDMPNPDPRSKDIPCNLASHLLVRESRLEWLQIMRSNDFFWGFPYNIIEFTTLQEIMCGWLGVDVGEYVHISDSLHVYERHWPYLQIDPTFPSSGGIPLNNSDLRMSSYDEWSRVIGRVITHAQRFTQESSIDDLASEIRKAADLPSAYFEWVALLGAEAMRRRGFLNEATKWVEKAGPVWSLSWKQWAGSLARRTNKKPVSKVWAE